ncbi:hypothetical protein U9M48_016231 [Paspalum notatum var. saurae]|uniref:Uncharacterized protein n=1 Tax=Paspalum notatum var. saurae TaxID=547442 RepID=A0AAQ3T6M0_PASNO
MGVHSQSIGRQKDFPIRILKSSSSVSDELVGDDRQTDIRVGKYHLNLIQRRELMNKQFVPKLNSEGVLADSEPLPELANSGLAKDAEDYWCVRSLAPEILRRKMLDPKLLYS